MKSWYKQLGSTVLRAQIIWGQWAIGFTFSSGMYRSKDIYDPPHAKDPVKYWATELEVMLGPICITYSW